MSYRQKMHRSDVIDILEDLEIPRHLIHPITITLTDSLMLMPQTYGAADENGIKNLRWVVLLRSNVTGGGYDTIVELYDLFELQNWFVNEYEKYK